MNISKICKKNGEQRENNENNKEIVKEVYDNNFKTSLDKSNKNGDQEREICKKTNKNNKDKNLSLKLLFNNYKKISKD